MQDLETVWINIKDQQPPNDPYNREYWELKEKGLRKVLTHNSVKCLECGEVLVSKSQHHFVSCSCKNQCFTDGGLTYNRTGAVDLDKVENLCKYVIMTEQEYEDMLERKRIEEAEILQQKIDAGLMVKFGDRWISKEVYGIIMKQCLKLGDK